MMAVGMIFNPYTAGRFGPRPPAGVVGRGMTSAPQAPATLASALTSPAAEAPRPVVSVGPESDALAKALLAQATQGGELHTPFEALGRLAQLGAGTWAEDKFQKAEKEREKAPWTAFRDAMASGQTLEQALAGSNDPTLLKLYAENELKKGAKGEFLKGSPGDEFIDPTTMKPAYTVPTADSSKPVVVDGHLVDPKSGKSIYDAPPKPGFHNIAPGEIAFDDAGNPIAGVPKPKPETFRPLTAVERQQWGITPDDPNSYAIGADGKPVKVADSDLLSEGAVGQKEKIAAAGRSAINVNPQESKYSQTVGEGLGGISIEITKNAMKAPGMQATLSRLEQLAQDPNFYSGTGSELVTQAKKALAVVSGDPSVAASNEAFGSLSNQVVLNKIGSLGTGISNADRSFIEGIAPRLNNTPEGNKLVIDTLRKLTQRDVDVAKFAAQYRAGHAGQLDESFPIALNEWAEQHPLFSAAPTAGSAPAETPPVPDAKKAPDGNWYVPDPKRPGKYLQVMP